MKESTGLIDKNGTEILEGDMIRFWENPNVQTIYRTVKIGNGYGFRRHENKDIISLDLSYVEVAMSAYGSSVENY